MWGFEVLFILRIVDPVGVGVRPSVLRYGVGLRVGGGGKKGNSIILLNVYLS